MGGEPNARPNMIYYDDGGDGSDAENEREGWRSFGAEAVAGSGKAVRWGFG